MVAVNFVVPFLQIRVAEVFQLHLAENGGIDVDENFHRRDKERARTARRVEQAERRQDFKHQGAADFGVEVKE